jgi:plastocyanin
MRRSTIALLVTLALLAVSAPALAGGWATVRLDAPPDDVRAGVSWRFGFMVLQHDVTPNSDVSPIVRAVHRDSGEEVTARAQQEGAVGHFVAELTLPRAGEWKWTITPEPYAETAFATLHVLDPGRAATPAPDRPGAETIASGPAEAVEILDSYAFQPASVEIAAGTTVTWINRSSVAHTVTSDSLEIDDSGLIDPGQSFGVTFDAPGTFPYRCSPHPGMEGVIVVA